jgi:hypothetical protein
MQPFLKALSHRQLRHYFHKWIFDSEMAASPYISKIMAKEYISNILPSRRKMSLHEITSEQILLYMYDEFLRDLCEEVNYLIESTLIGEDPVWEPLSKRLLKVRKFINQHYL